jgi:hypothetical protein
MTYVTIESSGDLEIDFQITLVELSLRDGLHPTNLIDIAVDEDDWSEISYYDAMGRYAAS